MRDEEVSKGRECVCPEVNRNKNIGEVRRIRSPQPLCFDYPAHQLSLHHRAVSCFHCFCTNCCFRTAPSRLQVGANMNKQAFKRYLQTMSWNENQTVGGGGPSNAGLPTHCSCLVTAGHLVRLIANQSPA